MATSIEQFRNRVADIMSPPLSVCTILPQKSYRVNHKLSQFSGIEIFAMAVHVTKKYA
jgi:hypothetical protein